LRTLTYTMVWRTLAGRRNGDPKTLPLVPAVIEELERQKVKAGLLFASKR